MLLHLPVLEKGTQLPITGNIVREQAATMFHLCMGQSRGGERHEQADNVDVSFQARM